jgi:hypothetical protein
VTTNLFHEAQRGLDISELARLYDPAKKGIYEAHRFSPRFRRSAQASLVTATNLGRASPRPPMARTPGDIYDTAMVGGDHRALSMATSAFACLPPESGQAALSPLLPFRLTTEVRRSPQCLHCS